MMDHLSNYDSFVLILDPGVLNPFSARLCNSLYSHITYRLDRDDCGLR
jgi:hypothetical protein